MLDDASHCPSFSAISDDNRSLVACSSGGADATLTMGLSVGLNAWHVMSGPGAFHPTHFDANGLQTIIAMKEGFKAWLWGRRKRSSGRLVAHPGDGKDWHWNLFKDHHVYLTVLGPGDIG